MEFQTRKLLTAVYGFVFILKSSFGTGINIDAKNNNYLLHTDYAPARSEPSIHVMCPDDLERHSFENALFVFIIFLLCFSCGRAATCRDATCPPQDRKQKLVKVRALRTFHRKSCSFVQWGGERGTVWRNWVPDGKLGLPVQMCGLRTAQRQSGQGAVAPNCEGSCCLFLIQAKVLGRPAGALREEVGAWCQRMMNTRPHPGSLRDPDGLTSNVPKDSKIGA